MKLMKTATTLTTLALMTSGAVAESSTAEKAQALIKTMVETTIYTGKYWANAHDDSDHYYATITYGKCADPASPALTVAVITKKAQRLSITAFLDCGLDGNFESFDPPSNGSAPATWDKLDTAIHHLFQEVTGSDV